MVILKFNDMKFRLFSIFALAGLLLGSCAVDELPAEGGSIIAEMETDQTRTAVTDEGTFTWSAGDKVWLHTTSGSVVGTLSSGAGTSSAQFSYGAHFGTMTGKAVYPYNEGHSVSGDQLSVLLPASYDLGSNLSNTNAAMYGVNVGGTIRFNHLAGVMRFVLTNVPAGANKFTITLDKKINGTFTADLTEAFPVLETEAASSAAEKTITLNFDALTKTSDITLYIPLPVGTYTTLAIGLYDDDQAIWTYSNIVTNTISRKTLKLMPSVSMGGTVGGEIEGGDSSEPYIDEYGINHGPGVKIGETVWAPVNCGYHATDFKYGKSYQWGRKYGQGYSGEFYDNGSHMYEFTYSDASLPEIKTGGVPATTANDKNNENVFFTATSLYSNGDWSNNKHDDLWNSGTESNPVKTDYDPCPDGWRVPTYTELNDLISNNSSYITDENGCPGYWFSGVCAYTPEVPQVFFIAGGFLVCDGKGYNRGWVGNYWSSKPSGNYASQLNFGDKDQIQMSEGLSGQRALGCSVRCVHE